MVDHDTRDEYNEDDDSPTFTERIEDPKFVAEINEIHNVLQGGYDEKDPEMMSQRLTVLGIYLARVGEMYADATAALAEQRGIAAGAVDAKMPWSLNKEFIEANCATYVRLHTLVERTMRTITHQMDAMRTQISYNKQLMSYTNEYDGDRRRVGQ